MSLSNREGPERYAASMTNDSLLNISERLAQARCHLGKLQASSSDLEAHGMPVGIDDMRDLAGNIHICEQHIRTVADARGGIGHGLPAGTEALHFLNSLMPGRIDVLVEKPDEGERHVYKVVRGDLEIHRESHESHDNILTAQACGIAFAEEAATVGDEIYVEGQFLKKIVGT